jgi:hypothetical protein
MVVMHAVSCTSMDTFRRTSVLEHPQPSPCIRALQRGNTGSRGCAGWYGDICGAGEPTLSRHSSWGRPSRLPRWQSMPPHHCPSPTPLLLRPYPLPAAPTLSLPPPPSSASLPASPLYISKVSKE